MTRLVDWRGDPVMPAAWLEGYERIHPIHREPFVVGSDEQKRRTQRMHEALLRRRADGTRFGERR